MPKKVADFRHAYQSSVAIHLAENPECAKAYDDSCFHVLSFARSVRSLEVLEALLIKSKKPDLCVQKNTLTSLKLFRANDHD